MHEKEVHIKLNTLVCDNPDDLFNPNVVTGEITFSTYDQIKGDIVIRLDGKEYYIDRENVIEALLFLIKERPKEISKGRYVFKRRKK